MAFGKKPRTVSLGVYLDDELADRLAEALYAQQEASGRLLEQGEAAAVDQAVGDARKALDDATAWFRFAGIGRVAFERLVEAHPPGAGDPADARWSSETFAPALIAASLTDPVMDVADVEALFADRAWNVAELGALFAAALAVNTQARPVAVRQVDP